MFLNVQQSKLETQKLHNRTIIYTKTGRRNKWGWANSKTTTVKCLVSHPFSIFSEFRFDPVIVNIGFRDISVSCENINKGV